MRKLVKATGAGPRHFFGAREIVSQQKNLGRQFRAADPKVEKTRILAVMDTSTGSKSDLRTEAGHCINF
jgi:hypothetical protein